MAITPGSKILLADMQELAVLANSKATLPKYIIPGNPSSGNRNYAFNDWPGAARDLASNPQWQSELNRLRGNLAQLNLGITLPDTMPFSNFVDAAANSGDTVDDWDFYYPDAGTPVSMVWTPAGVGVGVKISLGDDINTGTNAEFQFALGQTLNINCNGTLQLYPGPGRSFSSGATITPVAGNAWVFDASSGWWFCDINAAIPPGIYTITVNDAGANMIPAGAGLVFCTHGFRSGTDTGVGFLINLTGSSAPIATQGIHNSKQIYKFHVSNAPTSVPNGLTEYIRTAPSTYVILTGIPGVWNTVPDTQGLIAHKSAGMVCNLNAAQPGVMPWNLLQTLDIGGNTLQVNPMLLGDLAPLTGSAPVQSNSYNQALPVESQSEPPGWIAGTYFSAGFTILDSNNNLQQVQTAGVSGSIEPNWSTTANTVDGGVTWKFVSSPGFTSAVHRPECVPRFPYYKSDETNPALLPPTPTSGLTTWGSYDQWNGHTYADGYDQGWQQDNLAAAWWIYSISFNRIGNNQKGNVLLPMQDGAGNFEQIPVTIGFIQNGAFASLGTYETGQTVQVLWPIFTTQALVYESTERVDIQAVAICTSGGGVTTGVDVQYPVSAIFVTQVEYLLNLIT